MGGQASMHEDTAYITRLEKRSVATAYATLYRYFLRTRACSFAVADWLQKKLYTITELSLSPTASATASVGRARMPPFLAALPGGARQYNVACCGAGDEACRGRRRAAMVQCPSRGVSATIRSCSPFQLSASTCRQQHSCGSVAALEISAIAHKVKCGSY